MFLYVLENVIFDYRIKSLFGVGVLFLNISSVFLKVLF